ncbi:sugar-binding domain-containing protein [Lysinibacter sp. HNR]|uniref:sugar-binding transcriptional regulator n=1 Tax=Lysinibacter sp. HNR TaxID=3031408 RepID=UPI0024360485|nr:sugar-binding domain-containing protein [Lysinibacter sp. HNR]WGD37048.1 sugar-binding domain-containing protein [Lysinibacter sp. HNR]
MTTYDPENNVKVRTAITAATLYYLENRTMQAIAVELGMSRSSVSRLLSYAREEGLVEITVHPPSVAPSLLEKELHSRFNIRATVVATPEHTNETDRLERVALAAARVLPDYIDSNMSVGVAWGATMSAVARNLSPHPTRNTQIVQLNGAANSRTTGVLYVNEILRRFGEAFTADILQFTVPAFFDNPLTKEALWTERSVNRIVREQNNLDVAIFSVGSPRASIPSHVYSGGYLDREDFQSLNTQNVVGDVLTVFYRADGSWADIPLNARASGPGLDVLRAVPCRVCVCSGITKVPSLRGAIAGNFVSDLIIDEESARALVDA